MKDRLELSSDFDKWLCEENEKFRAIPFPLTDEGLAHDRNRSQSEFGKEPEQLSHSSQTGRAFESLWQMYCKTVESDSSTIYAHKLAAGIIKLSRVHIRERGMTILK